MNLRKTDINKKITALALTLVTAAFTVGTASGLGLGYSVTINGIEVGAFKSESDAENVGSFLYDSDGINVEDDLSVSFGIVGADSFTSVPEAADNYRKNDPRYLLGATLFVSGEPVFNVSSAKEAWGAAKTLLDRYKEEGYSETSFSQQVEIRDNYVKKASLSSKSEAIELLEGAVSVETVTRESIYVCEPYGEVEVEDDSMYRGERAVASEGISGEKYVEYTTVKINGQEISKNITGETVITKPVNRVVKVGIKEKPKGKATGSFINPTSGSLSSTFGARWGRRHTGIDISAPAGTSICAADGGTVIYSDFMSGYGYLIQIDHGNGFVTYYAHCSALYAKTGDKVAQGDLIAAVGSTGNSTGNHLHFEVRIDGTPTDPLGYVNY